MDASVKKLLAQLRELEQQKLRINRDIDSINRALAFAGVKPQTGTGSHESEYVVKQPFAKMLLTDACMTIVRDHSPQWLSVTEVEFLTARGGYSFSTANSKSSVSVTLRRLAEQGKCEVEKVRGSQGSRYRFVRERNAHDVEDSRATKT
jgi:hypothetical protein